MLRKFEEFTPEQWEKEYIIYRKKKNLEIIRNEIQNILEQERVLKISIIDGLVSLLIIRKILEELLQVNEHEIKKTFDTVSNKNFLTILGNDTCRGFISKALEKDLRTIFDELTSERMADLTEKKVKDKILFFAGTIFKGIKKHLKKEVNTEEAERVFTQLFCNEIFLIWISEFYLELDKRQIASEWENKLKMAPYLLKSHKEEIFQNPFIVIREVAKLVKINEAAANLWKEAATWLKALYTRSYLELPEAYRKDGVVVRNEEGKMPTANAKDKAFQYYCNLTFYEIALYYLQTSEIIETKCAPKQPLVVQISPSIITPQIQKVQEELEEEKIVNQLNQLVLEQQEVPVSVENTPEDKPENKESVVISLHTHPSSPRLFKPNPSNNVKGEKQSFSFSMFESFSVIENVNLNTGDVEKDAAIKAVQDQIPRLIVALRQYPLSDEQILILKEYKQRVISALKSYTDAYFSTYYIPTAIRSRPHTVNVTKAIKRIENAEAPIDQFLILLKLAKKIQGATSKDLEPNVIALIQTIFNSLYQSAKLEVKRVKPT